MWSSGKVLFNCDVTRFSKVIHKHLCCFCWLAYYCILFTLRFGADTRLYFSLILFTLFHTALSFVSPFTEETYDLVLASWYSYRFLSAVCILWCFAIVGWWFIRFSALLRSFLFALTYYPIRELGKMCRIHRIFVWTPLQLLLFWSRLTKTLVMLANNFQSDYVSIQHGMSCL